MMATGCLFCRIVAGEIPAKVIAEDDNCLAFRDINPQAPTHVLVIPKEHVASLNDLVDPLMIGRLCYMARAVARAEKIDVGGYRAVINTGDDGGQTVQHLHVHLFGGRPMGWPPG